LVDRGRPLQPCRLTAVMAEPVPTTPLRSCARSVGLFRARAPDVQATAQKNVQRPAQRANQCTCQGAKPGPQHVLDRFSPRAAVQALMKRRQTLRAQASAATVKLNQRENNVNDERAPGGPARVVDLGSLNDYLECSSSQPATHINGPFQLIVISFVDQASE
jgi:hypothetical protein